MSKTAIKIFRAKLQNILDIIEGDEPYERGIKSVVRALKADYDLLFPEKVWQPGSRVLTHRHMEKYCNLDKQLCPICGAPVRARVSKQGRQFLGCQRYPLCKGSRSVEGSPTINDAMLEFLSERICTDAAERQERDSSRFRNLEL